MASRNAIKGDKVNFPQSTSEDHLQSLQELGMLKLGENHSLLLRLPGEIRNLIYEELLYGLDEPLLLDQPPITRVCRQTRAEALPRYYGAFANVTIETSSSTEWVPFVQKVLDAFTGGARGLHGGSQSTLRYLGGLQLDFLTKDSGVHIQADLWNDPKSANPYWPGDPYEVVVVGSPGMDWTDTAAVDAACDEAATRLANDMTKRTAIPFENLLALVGGDDHVELTATSKPADQRAGVDAMRLFALACPQLRAHICVSDSSSIDEGEPSPLSQYRIDSLIQSFIDHTLAGN